MCEELSIYIHIPFCKRKCGYCDFVSYPNKEDEWEAYVRCLHGEIESWRDRIRDRSCPSVYIGGGTPSLIPAELLGDVLGHVRESVQMADGAEITLEANPGTVTRDSLSALRQAGFNRISFGAQALDDGLLQRLGRIHSSADVKESVALARQAGFENINIDLMYALPNQSMKAWTETLEAAIALDVAHISAYSLILEEGTPMYAEYEKGRLQIPDEETTLVMQRTATRMLAGAGYHRYEISNYARQGRECRHNIRYWTRGEYLGLGCAAHSLMDGKRFHNPTALEVYFQGSRMQDAEQIDAAGKAEELLMLSLRMTRGLSLRQFQEESGSDFGEYAHRADEYVRSGLAEYSNGYFRLTEKGMEVQDAIVLGLLG